MQMRVKMQQPAYKCEYMQMRRLFVNSPIPGVGFVMPYSVVVKKYQSQHLLTITIYESMLHYPS